MTSLLPIQIQGTSETVADTGAVRIDPEGGLQAIRLQAEHFRIDHAWQRSVRADLMQTNVVVDEGEDSTTLRAAKVAFEGFEGQPLLLALAEREAQLSISSTDGLEVAPANGFTMVDVGMSPEAARVGSAPDLGYWHTTAGPTVTGVGDGNVSLRGSFSLFVHNIALTARGDDGSWSNWTGQREGRPDGPAAESELRITVLHITNGTLRVPSTKSLVFALPQADVQMEGLLSLESATGRLVQEARELVLREEPLVLAGTGNVRLGVSDAVEGRSPGLSIRPAEGLQILTASGTWADPRPADSRSWRPTLLGIGATGGAFAVLLEMGVMPWTIPGHARSAHRRWMRRGRRAVDRRRWRLAAWCYRNAVRTKKDDALAWYDWASAEFEGGRWQKADLIAERAASVPGIEEADLLELRASGAWLSGDHAACREFLDRLAREQPSMAMGLVQDLQIDPAALGGPVPHLVAIRRTEDPPYGYA